MPSLAELLQKCFDRLNKRIDSCDNILMFRDLLCAVYFDLLNEPFWLKRHELVPSSHRGCICLVAFVFPLIFCFFIGKESSAAKGSRKAVGSPSLETITSWLDEILSALWMKLVSFNLLWAGLFGLETSRCPFQRRLFFEAATWRICATSAAVISDGTYPAKGGCCGCTGGQAHVNQNQERWQCCSCSGLFSWLFIPAAVTHPVLAVLKYVPLDVIWQRGSSLH